MRRIVFALLLLVGLAGCSWMESTPPTALPSSTSDEYPPIATAKKPIPTDVNDSHEHSGGSQDFIFDVEDATRTVEQVTAALESRDWDTLFTFVSSHHKSHMTAEIFASSMVAQEDQLGEIVEVEILSVPELQPDASDHVMFMVEIAVTYQKGEQITVNKYFDYYVLEEGGWMVEESVPNLEQSWQ